MSTMLRQGLRSSQRNLSSKLYKGVVGRSALRSFATQSGDDAKKPTALAKIYLEDGTTLTGRSFGCHEAVEGEVRLVLVLLSLHRRDDDDDDDDEEKVVDDGRRVLTVSHSFNLLLSGRLRYGNDWLP